MASAGTTATERAAREMCLESLDEFISTCQNDITSLLDTLDWTPEHFMQPVSKCTCPVNPGHRLPRSSLAQHQSVCQLVSQGITREEALKILEDTSYFYEGAKCVYSVKLDKDILNSVLWNHHVQNHSVFYGYPTMPLTPDQETQQLSREDRLGLSEYIVKKAKEANRLKNLGRDELLVSENLADLIKKDDEERKLDPVEEMAALRDYRRRRQTYRAKNVHITKKSHTEIMREVITNQMEMYARSLSDQPEDAGPQHSDSKESLHQEKNEESKRKGNNEEKEHDRDMDRDRYRRDRERDRYGDNRIRDSKYRDSSRDDRVRDRSRDDRERDRSRDRDRTRDRDDYRAHRENRYRRDDRSMQQEERKRSRSRSGSEIRDRLREADDEEGESVTDDRTVMKVERDEDDGDEKDGEKERKHKSKHKHRERKRSRSRSKSGERSKKRKHKKKHKRKHRKSSNKRSPDRHSKSVDRSGTSSEEGELVGD